MQPKNQASPKQYVSISEGKARVIADGIPTCADTTFRDALSIFRRQFPKGDLAIYDGDKDRWIAEPKAFAVVIAVGEMVLAQ